MCNGTERSQSSLPHHNFRMGWKAASHKVWPPDPFLAADIAVIISTLAKAGNR